MVTYTPRQKRILKGLEDTVRSYQCIVYDSSLKLYELIKDEPVKRLNLIVNEFKELANNSIRGDKLSKPREQFDPVVLKLYNTIENQGHSVHSYSCTIIELTKVIEDYKKVKIVPKGLKGAFITLIPKKSISKR